MRESSKAGHALCRKNGIISLRPYGDAERENNMNETYITTELLAQYAQQLYEEEKSSATIEKYIRDVRTFSKYAGSQALTKDLTIAYKRELPTRGYTILSVNSMLASLNSFLVFCGRADCKVKLYRVQKKTYLAANRELSKAEYLRLLHAARKDQRLCAQANVNPDKVFPHNLRKLFARTFYRMEKDIAKLADILGHSSINTTRIYIMSTGTEHRHQMEKLGLLA